MSYYLSIDYSDEELALLINERRTLENSFFLYDLPLSQFITKASYVEKLNHDVLNSGTKYLLVKTTKGDKLVAWIGLYNINYIDRNCELALHLVANQRNKNIAHRFFYLIDRYCRDYLGLVKYYYSCYETNKGTVELAKKLNHTYIGKYSKHKFTNGVLQNVLFYERMLIN